MSNSQSRTSFYHGSAGKIPDKRSAAKSANAFADHLAGLHMQSLTGLAKLFLPNGIWNGKAAERLLSQDASIFGGSPEIHLTFDDGPNPATTPHLLELFETEGVKATFFVIGKQVEKHEQLLLDISKGGHTIGNHTQSHAFLPMLTEKEIEKEILTTNQRIKDITGSEPNLFRPPFGIVDQKTHRLLTEKGMNTVYWSAFSEDWRHIGEHSVVERLYKHAVPGGIMVMHELEPTGNQTIAATAKLIRKLKDRDFSFSALAT